MPGGYVSAIAGHSMPSSKPEFFDRKMSAVSSMLEAAVTTNPIQKLTKTLEEWRELLTPEQYAVLFEEATERPFSHELDSEKRAGTFLCAACQLPLFSSELNMSAPNILRLTIFRFTILRVTKYNGWNRSCQSLFWNPVGFEVLFRGYGATGDSRRPRALISVLLFLVVRQTRTQETVEPSSNDSTREGDYDDREPVTDEREDRTWARPQ